jgi:signal transduction histidine kinase
VYRIAQEGLTNVLKHAGPVAAAFLQLTWGDDDVTLTVSDDGRGAAAQKDDHGGGIEGMRQRATVFGGTLTAGPKAGGGFLLRARLPLPYRDDHARHNAAARDVTAAEGDVGEDRVAGKGGA